MLVDYAVELGISIAGGLVANVGSYYLVELLKNRVNQNL
jgi:hypothetical protein